MCGAVDNVWVSSAALDSALTDIGPLRVQLISELRHTRVFGRSVGTAYQDHRDDATPADIEPRPSMADYLRYIRVHDAEFVAGTLGNGVSLAEMIKELGTNAFVTIHRGRRVFQTQGKLHVHSSNAPHRGWGADYPQDQED